MEVTIISRGVEISIAGGVAETEDANYCDRFFLLFLNLAYLLFLSGQKCTTVLIPQC